MTALEPAAGQSDGPVKGQGAVASSSANLTKSTLRGGGLLSLAAVAQVLLQFVTVGILARILNPYDFGVAAAALVMIELSQSMAQLGMRPAVVQRFELSEVDIRSAYTLTVVLSLVLAAAVFLLAGPIAVALNTPAAKPMLQVLSLVFVIQSQGAVAEGLAARHKQFGLLAARRVTSYLVAYGLVGITCALMGLGAWALVAAKLADAIVTAVLLSIGAPHSRRPLFHRAATRRLSGFGAGYTVNQIANTLANQSDYMVVARTLGVVPLGLYSRSYQIMRLPAQLIGNVVEDVAFPGFSSIQNEPERMARGFYRALLMMNIVLYLAAAGCVVLAPEIIAVALGPKWGTAAPLLQMFALAIPFRSTQRLATTISFSTGTNWPIAIRQIIYFLSVVAGAWFGSAWGLNGVVVGVSMAILIQTAIQFQLTMRLTGLSMGRLMAAHLRPVPAALLFGLPAWGVAVILRHAGTHPAMTLLVASMVGGLALVIGVATARQAVLMNEGMELVLMLSRKLPKRFGRPIGAWAGRGLPT